MTLRKSALEKARLYVIVGSSNPGKRLETLVEQAIRGGAGIIQLRCKESSPENLLGQAKRLREVTRSSNALFIINDYPEIAVSSDADGVHIGQDDMSIEEARKIVGPDRLVGQSTHSKEQALKAQQEGADYIGYGPLFTTPTKPDYQAIGLEAVRLIREEITIPYFVIGGVSQENCREILDYGASRVAVVRAVTEAEDVEQAARHFNGMLSSL